MCVRLLRLADEGCGAVRCCAGAAGNAAWGCSQEMFYRWRVFFMGCYRGRADMRVPSCKPASS